MQKLSQGMHQNGHSPPIPVNDCDLFKHLPDRKHQWHPGMLPRGALASISQETDLQTRHRSLLRHLLIAPRQSWAQRNLTRVSRRPRPLLSPILLLYLGNKNKLHLHLWSDWADRYSFLSPALSHKRKKTTTSTDHFYYLGQGKALGSLLCAWAPGSLPGSGCFHTSPVAENLSSPRLASPTSCSSLEVEGPWPSLSHC